MPLTLPLLLLPSPISGPHHCGRADHSVPALFPPGVLGHHRPLRSLSPFSWGCQILLRARAPTSTFCLLISRSFPYLRGGESPRGCGDLGRRRICFCDICKLMLRFLSVFAALRRSSTYPSLLSLASPQRPWDFASYPMTLDEYGLCQHSTWLGGKYSIVLV